MPAILFVSSRSQRVLQSFARWLLELGNGTLQCPDATIPNLIEVPQHCNIVQQDIVDAIFDDMTNSNIVNMVILTPTNEKALDLNNKVLTKKVPGEVKVYLSADKAVCDDEIEADNYPIEFLNSLTPSGMPPHRLLLKRGAIIMLLRNLNITRGLCNGTRLRVHQSPARVYISQPDPTRTRNTSTLPVPVPVIFLKSQPYPYP